AISGYDIPPYWAVGTDSTGNGLSERWTDHGWTAVEVPQQPGIMTRLTSVALLLSDRVGVVRGLGAPGPGHLSTTGSSRMPVTNESHMPVLGRVTWSRRLRARPGPDDMLPRAPTTLGGLQCRVRVLAPRP